MGTLLYLEDPAPRLRALLSTRHGIEVGIAKARAAFAREVAYYRAHHLEGKDPKTLADLRRRCALELGSGLGDAGRTLTAEELTALLLDSLRFAPFPESEEVLSQLVSRGFSLGVVSNWDISIADRLAELGLSPYFSAVVSSAAAGAAKPDPRPFRIALAKLGVSPEDALHVGDSPQEDLAGARAAGVNAYLLDRTGTGSSGLRSLRDLVALLDPGSG